MEKLRSTSKRIDKDLEVLFGKLSMEFFEKITGQCERLRKEMDRANRKYSERRDLWRKCVEKREKYDERRQYLLQWLAGTECRISTIPSNEAADMGKAITDFAGLAKEIMTR